MGVLYEHWRTDTNECFYVGISWAEEQTRPYNLKNRSKKHLQMQSEILKNGGKIEVKIQAWDLTKEELFELEIMQIAYWKGLIGNRLVNISEGGSLGPSWDEESLEQASKRMKNKWQNFTIEQKELFCEKIKKSHAANNPEKREQYINALSEGHKIFWENASEGFRLKNSKHAKEISTKYWNNVSEEKRKIHSIQSKENLKKYFDTRSEDKKIEHNKSLSEGQKRRFEKITKEEKERIYKLASETHKKKWEEKTIEEKEIISQKKKDFYKNMTPEQKKEHGLKISRTKQKISKEKRTEIAMRIWKTRRENKKLKDNKL